MRINCTQATLFLSKMSVENNKPDKKYSVTRVTTEVLSPMIGASPSLKKNR